MTSVNPNITEQPLCLCKTDYRHLCPEHVPCGASPYARLRMITHALLLELDAGKHPLVRKVEAINAEAMIKYRTAYDDYAAQNPGPAAPKES